MEDVLDVYTRPYDPRFPQVCPDETHTHLLGEVRDPLPCAPGQVARHDPEYVRGGVANLFLVCEPLRGWRHVTVTERRTGIDWAHRVKELVDVHYPDAEKIVAQARQIIDVTDRSPLTAGLRRMADNLDRPAQVLLDPFLACPRVALIRPDMLETRERSGDVVQEERYCGAILRIGGVHPRPEDEAEHIHEQMSFSPGELLRPVVTAHAPDARRFDRLTVDDARARLRIPPLPYPFSFAQDGIQVLPCTIEAPLPEVMVDGLPRREIAREHPPGTAASQDGEDAIEDGPHGPFAGTATRWCDRQQRGKDDPLGVGQVTRIAMRSRHHSAPDG